MKKYKVEVIQRSEIHNVKSDGIEVEVLDEVNGSFIGSEQWCRRFMAERLVADPNVIFWIYDYQIFYEPVAASHGTVGEVTEIGAIPMETFLREWSMNDVFYPLLAIDEKEEVSDISLPE